MELDLVKKLVSCPNQIKVLLAFCPGIEISKTKRQCGFQSLTKQIQILILKHSAICELVETSIIDLGVYYHDSIISLKILRRTSSVAHLSCVRPETVSPNLGCEHHGNSIGAPSYWTYNSSQNPFLCCFKDVNCVSVVFLSPEVICEQTVKVTVPD